MTRVEERALEAYPERLFVMDFKPDVGPTMGDKNECYRNCYQQGYEQAEKDIIDIIGIRLSEIIGDAQPKPALRAELEELITRIKDGK